jgi:hypothetical protein
MYFTMFYERYPTPEAIMCSNFNEVFQEVRSRLSEVFRLYFPWLPEDEYRNYLDVHAQRRAEDYGLIKSFSLLGEGIKHLDIGPGLGSHALYSRYALRSLYCGLEAHPPSYQVQRNSYRCFSIGQAPYVDFVAAETFGVSDSKLADMLRAAGEGILHIPSWKFPVIDDNFFDLVTATWVLNEVNLAGILWLVAGSTRSLKEGGYFYVRDSTRQLPGRHGVDYDALLLRLGFEEVVRLQVKNRVDFHGIPRMYRKTQDTKVPSYDELVNQTLGHFGNIPAQGAYGQRQG